MPVVAGGGLSRSQSPILKGLHVKVKTFFRKIQKFLQKLLSSRAPLGLNPLLDGDLLICWIKFKNRFSLETLFICRSSKSINLHHL